MIYTPFFHHRTEKPPQNLHFLLLSQYSIAQRIPKSNEISVFYRAFSVFGCIAENSAVIPPVKNKCTYTEYTLAHFYPVI
jgi:hypothetical protein